MNKWRETHSGTESEEMTAAQLAEYKKIKAELREARMGDRFLEKSGGLLRAGVLIKTRYAHIHRGEGNYPTRLMCRCLEVSHSGYYAWRNSGMSETQKRREELAIFVTYSSHKTKSCHWAASPESPPMDKTPSQSQVRLYFHLATGKGFCLKSAIFLQRLQTNPPVIDGSTKPWNAGGVATSPERVRRLMQPGGPGGVSAPPQGPHHRACCRPGRASRPDRKGLHG